MGYQDSDPRSLSGGLGEGARAGVVKMSDEVIMYAVLPNSGGIRIYFNTDQGHDPVIDVIGDVLDIWPEPEDESVDLTTAQFQKLEDQCELPMCEVPLAMTPPDQVEMAPQTPPPTAGMSELDAAAYTVHTTARHVCVHGHRGTGKMEWVLSVVTQAQNLDTRITMCTAEGQPYFSPELNTIIEPMSTKFHQSPRAWSEDHPASFYESLYKSQVKQDSHLAAMWRDTDIVLIVDAEGIDECILGALLVTAIAYKTRLVLVADFARGLAHNQKSFAVKSPMFADHFSESTFSTADVKPTNPLLPMAAVSGDPPPDLRSALLGTSRRGGSDGCDGAKGPRIVPFRKEASAYNEQMFLKYKGGADTVRTYRHKVSYDTSAKKIHSPIKFSAPDEITLYRGCRVFNVLEQRLATVDSCPDDDTVEVIYDSELGSAGQDDLKVDVVFRHVYTMVVKKDTHTLEAIPLAYGWAVAVPTLIRPVFHRATFRVVLYPDGDKGFKPLFAGALYRVCSTVKSVEHLSIELLMKRNDGAPSRIFVQGTVLLAIKALFSSAEPLYGSDVTALRESTQRAVSEVSASGALTLGVYRIPDSLNYFLQTFPKGRKSKVEGWQGLPGYLTGEFRKE